MRLDVHNTRATDGEHLWKTVDEWHSTYWSGLDARFYANDVYLDEITGLSYQLQEAVNPLFSYASYTAESYLHGARRVQGQFSINFKREGYLFELLRELALPKESAVPAGSARASDAFMKARTGQATVEHFTALAAADGPTEREANGRVKFDPKLLDEVAHDFERALWGEPASAPRTGRLAKVEQEVNSRLREFAPRFQVPRTWDLSVQFGSTEAARTRRSGRGPVPSPDTAVVPTFPVATATRLVGMALTGVGREIDDSGRPLLEVYTFIARDVR